MALIEAAVRWGAEGINDSRHIVVVAALWERWVNGDIYAADLATTPEYKRLLDGDPDDAE